MIPTELDGCFSLIWPDLDPIKNACGRQKSSKRNKNLVEMKVFS